MIGIINNIKEDIKSISSETLNGENYSRDDFARSILNYPAMMVPSVQEPIIEKLSGELNHKVSLLDPFTGASNTLVTGMKYGMEVFGQDINPLSILLSQVKTTLYNREELEDAEKRITPQIKNDKSECIEIHFPKIDKWFTKEVQVDLSKIYRAIKQETDINIRKFFWVALAETIRLSSNDRTSTFKMHMRSPKEIDSRQVAAITLFTSISKKNIDNIANFISILKNNGHVKEGKYTNRVDIVWGDTKAGVQTTKTFNLLVTSPPYGDNQTTVTYGQFSYLPLQWIPFEDIDETININYLATTQTIDSNSLGGKAKENIKNIEER
ncbi:MAG: hypothetical protein LIO77_08150, partial [Rikenellaceae bacterium]|nr:hypothetical protein [Rikenellaceae bacterium]